MPWWTKGILIILLKLVWSCTAHTAQPTNTDKQDTPLESWFELLYGKSDMEHLANELSMQGFEITHIGNVDFELYTEQHIPSWLDSLFQIGYTYKSDKGYLVYRPKDVTQRYRRIEIQPYPEKQAYSLLFEPSSEF